ncbi:MAG TPA: hypothetical protein PLI01_15030 [Nitrospira sp.]|nr:hypothetical protein [Nitrospira sp.]
MTEALAYGAAHAQRYDTAYYEFRQVMKYLGVGSYPFDSMMERLGLSFDFREDPLG